MCFSMAFSRSSGQFKVMCRFEPEIDQPSQLLCLKLAHQFAANVLEPDTRGMPERAGVLA